MEGACDIIDASYSQCALTYILLAELKLFKVNVRRERPMGTKRNFSARATLG